MHGNDRRVLGFNNVELITDRPLGINLEEVRQIKRDWPDRALVVSVMLPMREESWAKYVPMIEDTGADGLELNFGCPHGMSERGMGSAVGQVPEYIQLAAEWCKTYARVPVIVKLTPNITNILPAAKAAMDGGADAVSLINTLNSIMRVDYETLTIYPATDGKGSHGGYCGPAVKPIALHMVAEIARSPETARLPISGTGATRSTSSRSARPPCRSALQRWFMGSRSSMTWWTGCRTTWSAKASHRCTSWSARRCRPSRTGST
jgi:dihydropyrimidine dehydrogenase (NAD+) subunit PreA